jgi:hypothetical protein
MRRAENDRRTADAARSVVGGRMEMEMLNWIDEKNRDGSITSSRLVVPGIDIIVHHHIDYDAQQWLVSTYPEHLKQYKLAGITLFEAKSEAVRAVQGKLRKIASALDSAP